MTVHRSQSQSIDYVVSDLSTPAFGPGQMYTAWSRLRQSDRLLIIVDETTQIDTKQSHCVQVTNIIIPSLILQRDVAE